MIISGDRKDIFYKKAKAGDLIFCRSESIIGKIIRWVTTSRVNHVGIYTGVDMIEAMDFSGVRYKDVEEYFDDPKMEVFLCRVKGITRSKRVKSIEEAEKYLRERYDFIGLIGILAKYLVKKMRLGWLISFWGKNRLDNPKEVWCSELVVLVFNKIGIRLVDTDPSYATPEDIYNSEAVEKIEF